MAVKDTACSSVGEDFVILGASLVAVSCLKKKPSLNVCSDKICHNYNFHFFHTVCMT